MEPTPSPKHPAPLRHLSRHHAAMPSVLALAALWAYRGTLRAGFVNWDDDRFFSENPLFHGPVTTYVLAALTRVQFEAYHPLHLLSYLPDRLLWPRSTVGFHALNLALFAAVVAWLHALLRRHVPPGPAALACLLFALHPVLVEPVAWASGRKDVLALLFAVAVLWREDRAPEQQRFDATTLVLCCAATLTKTSAVVLPIFIFAWQRWVRGRPVRAALLRAAPAGIGAAGIGVVVPLLWSAKQMLLPSRPLALPLDVLATLAFYARRVIWPAGLAPVYPVVPDGFTAGAAALSVLLGVLLLAWARLPPAARFAAVTFFGALLPVSNLFPLYYRFADRYQALALLALVWPSAAALAAPETRGGRLRVTVAAGALACALILGTTTHALANAWTDSRSLWKRAVQVQPRAFHAHLKLAQTLRAEGNHAGAATAYRQAIQLQPDSALGFVGLFTAVCEGAEARGEVPPGSAGRWKEALSRAIESPAATERLAHEMAAAGCPECARAARSFSARLHGGQTNETAVPPGASP